MIQILTVIAPLFLIIFASAVLQYYKKIGDNWSEVLNDFALKIGLPILIFSALAKTPFSFFAEAKLIIFNSLFIISSLLLACAIGKIFRLKKQMFLTLFICFVFNNVAYLGIPVLTQVFGAEILPTVSIIIALYLFWMFTVGTGYLGYSSTTNKKNIITNLLKNFIKNPLLLAVIFGLFVSSFNITLPSAILQSLDMISASVAPTVLIVIGLFIGTSKIGKASDWFPALLFSLCTLAVSPASFYFGLTLFGYAPNQFSSSIIQAAMPLAITPFALADTYNLNKTFIARSIVLSTILSVLTLPFWIAIMAD